MPPILRGPDSPRWKGGTTMMAGYKRVACHGHPRANRDGYVLEHILIAEKALGKPLPAGCEVHHAAGKGDNSKLVICQDHAYHALLHRRMRVLAAGGIPDADKVCSRCKALKPHACFGPHRKEWDGLRSYCRECNNLYEASRKQA